MRRSPRPDAGGHRSTFVHWWSWRVRARPAVVRRQVHGMAVVVEPTPTGPPPADVLSRLDEALALIAAVHPWRLVHLRRDVTEIRVIRFPCRGAYLRDVRAIVCELTFLGRRDLTAAPVAASLLHEGVHARVQVMATRWGWSMVRDAAAEERLCRRAELAFGYALPPALGAPVIARAAGALALDDASVAPVVDWAEAMARLDAGR